MAKIGLTKLNKIKTIPDKIVELESGEQIEVKQYLSLSDKLDLMDAVIGLAGDEQGFFNIVKLRVLYEFKMLQEYTNINFTAKQEEEIGKTYDIIYLNNIWGQVATAIPEIERDFIWNNILQNQNEPTEIFKFIVSICFFCVSSLIVFVTTRNTEHIINIRVS